jgi:hypothetical protein
MKVHMRMGGDLGEATTCTVLITKDEARQLAEGDSCIQADTCSDNGKVREAWQILRIVVEGTEAHRLLNTPLVACKDW